MTKIYSNSIHFQAKAHDCDSEYWEQAGFGKMLSVLKNRNRKSKRQFCILCLGMSVNFQYGIAETTKIKTLQQ